MRVIGTESVVVKPELIRLVRRDDSKKWQVHYKLENLKTWFRRSTDTADIKEASKIAERMWKRCGRNREICRVFKQIQVVLSRQKHLRFVLC